MAGQVLTPVHQQFRVFVYGTLKRGGVNHQRFCRGISAVEEATVRGRLYRLSATIPVLEIPSDNILACGTMDYIEELQRQHTCQVPETDGPDDANDGHWRMIQGELLTFSEAMRLAHLDMLEGFRPPGHCLYRRVLASVRLRDGDWVTAWVYTIGDIERECLEPVEADCWR